jgi:hypothetical protein
VFADRPRAPVRRPPVVQPVFEEFPPYSLSADGPAVQRIPNIFNFLRREMTSGDDMEEILANDVARRLDCGNQERMGNGHFSRVSSPLRWM